MYYMSDEERNDLALKVERIETLLIERERAAAGNSMIIRTMAFAVVIQVLTTVYFAGVKSEKLDQLGREVSGLTTEVQSHTAKINAVFPTVLPAQPIH